MNKNTLRDNLFDKFFEVEEGIPATKLVEDLSFIPATWKQLHILCEKNIRRFDSFSNIEMFKLLEHNKKKYLILKIRVFKYIIIDIDKMENISREQLLKEFDEDFFVNNFNEVRTEEGNCDIYSLDKYNGNIQELLDFYIENHNIFNLPTELYYKITIGDAWTYLYIDFANANAQIGFQTSDQSLYEQLFLKYNLTAYEMQDATSKIGIEKMQEMFSKIKGIKIPKEAIPNKLYEMYINNCNKEKHLKNN